MEVNSSAADFSTKVMRFWGNGTVEDNVTMLGPIMAYPEKIPGATTGVTKRIDRRNGGGRGEPFRSSTTSEFTEGGITYIRVVSGNGDISLDIMVNKNHVIYLADYND